MHIRLDWGIPLPDYWGCLKEKKIGRRQSLMTHLILTHKYFFDADIFENSAKYSHFPWRQAEKKKGKEKMNLNRAHSFNYTALTFGVFIEIEGTGSVTLWRPVPVISLGSARPSYRSKQAKATMIRRHHPCPDPASDQPFQTGRGKTTMCSQAGPGATALLFAVDPDCLACLSHAC